jgi:hypothetical protein
MFVRLVRRFNGQTIPSERPGVMRENSMLVLLGIFCFQLSKCIWAWNTALA